MNTLADDLDSIITTTVPRLRALNEADAARVPAPGKWSRKQELGHLLDSAVNNHMRIVRLQSESRLELPGYQQEHWIRAHRYQDRPWSEIVDSWQVYNRDVAWLIRHIEPASLRNLWRSPDGVDVDLEFIVRDYLVHMNHHLDHILS